jgi:hypothetical protein
MVIAVDMDNSSLTEVSDWLQRECKIDPEQAKIFVQEKVDGEALALLTEKMLMSTPFHLKTGDALKTIAKIKKLQGLGKLYVKMLCYHA